MKIKCHHFTDFNQDRVIEMTNNSQFISIIRFYSRKEGMLGESEYHIRMSNQPLLDEAVSDSYSLVKTKIWFRLHRILNISYISLNDIIKEVKTSNFIIGKQIPKKEDVLLYKKSNCMFFLKVISIDGNSIHYQRITISDPCQFNEYVLNNDIVNLYSNIEYAFTESYKITNGDYIWANLSSAVEKISKKFIYYFSYGSKGRRSLCL